jgi:GNAT superfamily N-acetyltransferase
MRIEYLADHPAHIDTLARWHHAQWGALLTDWREDAARAELATHTARCAVPTTLVALEETILLGSVSLLATDDERLPRYTPWLASLYVQPAWRGRGLGRALVERVHHEARALGCSAIYLYTTAAMNLRAFYTRLGWRELEQQTLLGEVVQIWRRDLEIAHA